MAADRHSLVARLRALAEAAESARGRLSDDAVDAAVKVSKQAEGRLAVSGDATVVALAGATGSGKSSTFNAVLGADLSQPGVRRPTTSQALAATVGSDAAEELLDWLDVRRRHQLASVPGKEDLASLVLLDLPDHDSTTEAHRTEVDRLVELVDVLVWVVDPQKYADAALHDNYLKPLARHAEVMLVLLNQIDKLPAADRKPAVTDLERLLKAEGLGDVEVIASSATTGEGIDLVRRRLAKQVAGKKAAAQRLAQDVRSAAERLRTENGHADAAPITKSAAERLNTSLATAAGVPTVTEAVGKAWRLRGGLATGWPVLSWIAKFRPDPLRRLHLDRLRGGGRSGGGRRREIDPARVGRSSLPAITSVQQARVDTATRDLVTESVRGLPRGWNDTVRAASRARREELADRLDRAIATTDLDMQRHRIWWQVVRVLQWLLIAAVVAGLGWLGVSFVLLYLQLPPLPEVLWWRFPAPTWLVAGGAVAGVLLALVSRVGVEIGALRRSRVAGRRLRAAIAGVTDELIIDPVNEELRRYAEVRDLLDRAAS
ncbi:GTPase [Propionibacteriaceae bacterium Y1685]|uniref:GTPase n=1 Tax=Microlunatus sp. Y1700 TaxID=3418487 RepID=UPI003B82393F